MKKLYFKTTGQEPDINCIDPCRFKDKPSENTMIGSGACQDCKACYGWDSEEKWVKCLNYSVESNLSEIMAILPSTIFLENTNRVEVIDQNGRRYANWAPTNKIEISLQDEGRTLKVFIKQSNNLES